MSNQVIGWDGTRRAKVHTCTVVIKGQQDYSHSLHLVL